MSLQEHDGTIGFPLPSTDVDIWRDDGSSCGVNEPGELVVKGPQVMQGYWGQPAESARVLKEGWLLTGDIAVFTFNGKLRIVDRKKDMIIVNGFNVYPNEIEEVIAAMPGVSAVAVVGVPDSVRGEEVRAFVVKRDQALTAETIIAHCHASLTGYKVPRRVVFMESLPTSAVGKILRKTLREM
jgi:long-chain acyl-CoA synthetase